MRGDSGVRQGQLGLGRKHHFSLRFFRSGCLFVPVSGQRAGKGVTSKSVVSKLSEVALSGVWRGFDGASKFTFW